MRSIQGKYRDLLVQREELEQKISSQEKKVEQKELAFLAQKKAAEKISGNLTFSQNKLQQLNALMAKLAQERTSYIQEQQRLGKLSELQTAKNRFTAQINSLNASLASIIGTITALKKDLITVKASLKEKTTMKASINSQITAMGDISVKKAEFDQLSQQKIQIGKTRLSRIPIPKLNNLNAQIRTLNTQINKYNGLQSQLKTLNGTLLNLQNQQLKLDDKLKIQENKKINVAAEVNAAKAQLKEMNRRLSRYQTLKNLITANNKETIAQNKLRAIYAENIRVLSLFETLKAEVDALKRVLWPDTAKLAELNQLLASFPQEKIKHFDDHFPILLLPLKIQTRFARVKYVASRLAANNVLLDVATLSPGLKTYFSRYQAQLNQLKSANQNSAQILSSVPLNDQATLWARADLKGHLPPFLLKRRDDQAELWVRIYPDQLFNETHEPALNREEIAAGQAYWLEVWAAQTGDKATPTRGQRYDDAWDQIQQSFGAARAIWILRQTINPHALEQSDPNAVFYQFNYSPQQGTKEKPFFAAVEPVDTDGWEKPTQTAILPSRFVVRTIRRKGAELIEREIEGEPLTAVPLILGFNPGGPDEAYPVRGGSLELEADIRWLSDFRTAERIGMAIRIPLSPEEAATGFDRLIVMGIKEESDPIKTGAQIERHFRDQIYSNGLSVVPQGTPTNNTPGRKAGGNSEEIDGHEVARLITKMIHPLNRLDRRGGSDGRRLDYALGFRESLFEFVQGGNQQGIDNAIWTNRALWIATMGYYLRTFFSDEISPSVIQSTYDFMNGFVLGRGHLPAIRIDDQPYGILAASAYSRWKYLDPKGIEPYCERLYHNVLSKLDAEWMQLAAQAPHLQQGTSATSTSDLFLRILGLQASSVSLVQRPMSGKLFQWQLQENMAPEILEAMETRKGHLLQRLKEWGLSLQTEAGPAILDQLIGATGGWLNAPMVQKPPLSETGSLNPNFIKSLQEAKFNEIRNNHHHPQSMLYLLLRHALLLEYLWTAEELLHPAESPIARAPLEFSGLIPLHKIDAEAKGVKENFIQAIAREAYPGDTKRQEEYIKSNQTALNKRAEVEFQVLKGSFLKDTDEWGLLNSPYHDKAVHAFLDGEWDKWKTSWPPPAETQKYRRFLTHRTALRVLQSKPPAELQRLFSEHLDCCHYRLDAWLQGLAAQRLYKNRNAKLQDGRLPYDPGLFYGAYGYLESIRPKGEPAATIEVILNPERIAISQVNSHKEVALPLIDSSLLPLHGSALTNLLNKSYVYLGNDSGRRISYDSSLQQVVAEPVLSGDEFIPAPSHAHAVTAAILKGAYDIYRNDTATGGNPYAINLNSSRVREALFFLEGINNGQDIRALLGYRFERLLHETRLDTYIKELRDQFPLSFQDEHGKEIKTAPCVVDGLQLIENKTDLKVPPQVRPAVEEIERKLDAVQDLLLSESVFQMARGRPNRIDAALRMLHSGQPAPIPEIVQTPRSGTALTNRFGLLLDSSQAGDEKNQWLVKGSRLSAIWPELNNYVSRQLPPANQILLTLIRKDVQDNEQSLTIGLDKIIDYHKDWFPIESLDFVLITQFDQADGLRPAAMGILLELVDQYLRYAPSLDRQNRLEKGQFIEWSDEALIDQAGLYTIFNLEPLLTSIYRTLSRSRLLLPDDLVPATVSEEMDRKVALERKTALEGLKKHLEQQKESWDQWNELLIKTLPEDPAGVVLSIDQRTRIREACWQAVSLGHYTFMLPQNAEDETLLATGYRLKEKLSGLTDHTANILKRIDLTDCDQALDLLKKAGRLLFGGQPIPLYIFFSLNNQTEVEACMRNPNLPGGQQSGAVDDWLQTLIPVRSAISDFSMTQLFAEAIHGRRSHFQVIQLPYQADDRWLAMPYGQWTPQTNPLAIVLETPESYQVGAKHGGLLVDEWTELIPDREGDMSLAIHYDQPNQEAPQCLLLAISPEESGKWAWDDLMDTIIETFDLAKKRAVEPESIIDHAAAQFLPTVVAPIDENKKGPILDFGEVMNHSGIYKHGFVQKKS